MRSRTTWFSAFMTCEDNFCYHEGLKYCNKLDDYSHLSKRKFNGDSDSSALFFINDIMEMFPDLRVVVIKRNYQDALHSLDNYIKTDHNEKLLELMANIIKALDFEHLAVDYTAIDSQCEKIWNYCLPEVQFDKARFNLFKNMRIEPRFSSYHNIGNLVKNKIRDLLCH